MFDSVSRMSRNAAEGFELYQELLQRGVELVFLKEAHIDTSVYKEAAEKQISAVQTGDAATDELMAAIIAGINTYMLRLAGARFSWHLIRQRRKWMICTSGRKKESRRPV